jgi:hypothetical protein
MEAEEVESVPWSELIAEERPPHDLRRLITLVVSMLGAAVVGAVVARAAWTPSAPTVIAPGLPATAQPAASDAPMTEGSSTTVTLPPLYSEADLMADPPDPDERAAVVRAEWFVTDYFTADYEPAGSADVRAALPGSALLPDLPQDGSGGISYVEWARAFDVAPAAGGAYLVSVAYRALGAPADGAFIRLPVRAVDVMVQVDESGASVVDLPRPAALPAGPEPPPWPEQGVSPPAEIVDRAAVRAAVWGTEPRLVSAAAVTEGWRVVMTVADGVGNRWPLAIVIPR